MPKVKLPRQTLVKDVSDALREIDRIGKPKRSVGANGKVKKDTGKVHSKTQKRHDKSACMNFAKWVKVQHGVKRLNHVKEEHVRAYLDFKKAEGVTIKHLQNIETSLRHLQNGSRAFFKRFDRDIEVFAPKKRIVSSQGRETPQNRSYSSEEMLAIKQGVSQNVRNAVELMRGLGLRSSEALAVRKDHFQQDQNGNWRLVIGHGEGITKGGRPREIPVRVLFVPTLEKLLEGKKEKEQLVKLNDRTVRKGISTALKKAGIEQNRRGCHGFRHAYARERVHELIQNKGLNEKGHQMLKRCLMNYDLGRKSNYGIYSRADCHLYSEVKNVIDMVHSELGHGKGRMDLAAVYMKD
ncbi:tyrosine-type recombinase/integrase [Domibacillus robiginosus]|uniref:tyrosine-type recombinase/integrase n=1 Tax=Domibacillus robiginosus TaxID=1071054 RepID=UPI00067CF044|nr:tyrosine-type recombinase/integrase [Domibacillus robiginosus]